MKIKKDSAPKVTLLKKLGYRFFEDSTPAKYVRGFYGPELPSGKRGVAYSVITKLEARLCSIPKLIELAKSREEIAIKLLEVKYKELDQISFSSAVVNPLIDVTHITTAANK